ncbi:MAG: ATPase [Gammaproteobacteria bacterium]|nr:ATPase [Gammaproteobacteria bacterium]
MMFFIGVLTFGLLLMIALGIYLHFNPEKNKPMVVAWHKRGMVANILLFFVASVSVLVLGVEEAMAAADVAQQASEISLGQGLAIIGVGLPTALATIGAGIAVGSVGSASLAVIAEKPEIFGRTLVYLGLAEGIAIYGLVVTILLLGKI